MRTLGIAVLAASAAIGAGVVDRVAVVVGNDVITESEVLREVRLVALMNGTALNLGPAARKDAADRLVDQQLIRTEMEIGNYPRPTAQEADDMLRTWRQEHFPSIPEYRAALEKYGVTEDEVKQYLVWQLAVMRFTDQRFRVGIPDAAAVSAAAPPAAPPVAPRSTPTLPAAVPADAAVSTAPQATTGTQGATAWTPSHSARGQAARSQSADRAAPGASVDDQMEAWLKQQRAATRVQFKNGAFGQ